MTGAFRRVFLNSAMISHLGMLFLLITSLVLFSLSRQEIPIFLGLASWILGWFLWTFTEYSLNRWLLHRTESSIPFVRSILKYHAQHHNEPENIQYMFIHPLIVGFSGAIFFGLSFLAMGKYALLLTSGFLLGYMGFVILHALKHHYTATGYFVKAFWQNHFLHHRYYPDHGFGVTISLWDFVFKSLPPKHLFNIIEPKMMKVAEPDLAVMEVNDRISEAMFLNVSESIYRHDRSWIPFLKSEIVNIFNPSVNPYFIHGEAKRWILVNESGEVIGRIAAFVNFQKIDQENHRVGCIGFFECVADQPAAFLLFDTAVGWLVENFNVTAVDGPVNFGENDKYWGLLISGFTPPSYGMSYNHPYYRKFFDAYGFTILYKQLTNYLDLQKPLPERFNKIACRIVNNTQYHFRPFSYKETDHFVSDFLTIYNKAWASFNNFQPMSEAVVRKSLAELKPIMEEDFIWFAYADNKPIGLLLSVPDINEILKYCGGEFNTWSKIKFVYYKYQKGFSRMRVVVMGIVPEFQNRGIESALILEAYKAAKKKQHYKHVELSWVGDFNQKMLAIHKAMGAVEDKEHATFRKIL